MSWLGGTSCPASRESHAISRGLLRQAVRREQDRLHGQRNWSNPDRSAHPDPVYLTGRRLSCRMRADLCRLRSSGRKPDGAAYGSISSLPESVLCSPSVLSESKRADRLKVYSESRQVTGNLPGCNSACRRAGCDGEEQLFQPDESAAGRAA